MEFIPHELISLFFDDHSVFELARAAAVSRTWYAIAVNHPSFWMFPRLQSLDDRDVNYWREQLRHGNRRPIYTALELPQSCEQDIPPEIFDLLEANMYRVTELIIEIHCRFAERAVALLSMSAPLLESIGINYWRQGTIRSLVPVLPQDVLAHHPRLWKATFQRSVAIDRRIGLLRNLRSISLKPLRASGPGTAELARCFPRADSITLFALRAKDLAATLYELLHRAIIPKVLVILDFPPGFDLRPFYVSSARLEHFVLHDADDAAIKVVLQQANGPVQIAFEEELAGLTWCRVHVTSLSSGQIRSIYERVYRSDIAQEHGPPKLMDFLRVSPINDIGFLSRVTKLVVEIALWDVLVFLKFPNVVEVVLAFRQSGTELEDGLPTQRKHFPSLKTLTLRGTHPTVCVKPSALVAFIARCLAYDRPILSLVLQDAVLDGPSDIIYDYFWEIVYQPATAPLFPDAHYMLDRGLPPVSPPYGSRPPPHPFKTIPNNVPRDRTRKPKRKTTDMSGDVAWVRPRSASESFHQENASRARERLLREVESE